jgi:hypothetical protein
MLLIFTREITLNFFCIFEEFSMILDFIISVIYKITKDLYFILILVALKENIVFISLLKVHLIDKWPIFCCI